MGLPTFDNTATSSRHDVFPVILGVAVSFLLWYLTFNTQVLGSFWARMVLSVSVLLAVAAMSAPQSFIQQLKSLRPLMVLIGLASGVGLYILFLAGYIVLRQTLVGGARSVYLLITDISPIAVGVILLFTSFGEEFFWRGFVQRFFSNALGSWGGLAVATAFYTAIHIPTFNYPLVLAALIAGLYWGVLYLASGSAWLTTASHIVWTEMILLLIPVERVV